MTCFMISNYSLVAANAELARVPGVLWPQLRHDHARRPEGLPPLHPRQVHLPVPTWQVQAETAAARTCTLQLYLYLDTVPVFVEYRYI